MSIYATVCSNNLEVNADNGIYIANRTDIPPSLVSTIGQENWSFVASGLIEREIATPHPSRNNSDCSAEGKSRHCLYPADTDSLAFVYIYVVVLWLMPYHQYFGYTMHVRYPNRITGRPI